MEKQQEIQEIGEWIEQIYDGDALEVIRILSQGVIDMRKCATTEVE
jgi:hypothetical protein